MTLNLRMPERDDLKPRITVFGVGGAGGNAVNNMIEKRLEGVEFVVANTDAQALAQSDAPHRIQLGVQVTQGLGAGAKPSIGAAAAEETIEEIVAQLQGAHMCFITAGMGGGTGTGAAPIIAQAARELGVLTVGVVTKPFHFEGAKRMRQAEEGVEALQRMVDTLIIIPNQNLFRLASEKTTFTEAFSMADDVLYQGVKGVTDLMVRPGLINLDFADVRAVMDEMGKAMMGTGEADGEERAVQAAEKAIANPLLDEISLRGAKGVLINITGGYDLTLFELDEAANRIREEVDPDANIIVGSTLDTEMSGKMRVSVVATGIDAAESRAEVPQPVRRRVEAAPQQAMPAARTAAAPAPAAAPVQQYAEPEPVAATTYRQRASEAPAPTLFDDDDHLPPPVYRSQQVAREEQFLEADDYADDEAAHAPREDHMYAAARDQAPAARPAPGTPSPEALARLRAAVGRASGGSSGGADTRSYPGAPAQPEPAADKARFGGLNSLINRMTGQAGEPSPQPSPRVAPALRQPSAAREAPRVERADGAAPDQERIEIPAFLRRQAN
jgi:cell division protein FtsZ